MTFPGLCTSPALEKVTGQSVVESSNLSLSQAMQSVESSQFLFSKGNLVSSADLAIVFFLESVASG